MTSITSWKSFSDYACMCVFHSESNSGPKLYKTNILYWAAFPNMLNRNAWLNSKTRNEKSKCLGQWPHFKNVTICVLIYACGEFIYWLFTVTKFLFFFCKHEKSSGLLGTILENRRNQVSFLQFISVHHNAHNHYHRKYNLNGKLEHI